MHANDAKISILRLAVRSEIACLDEKHQSVLEWILECFEDGIEPRVVHIQDQAELSYSSAYERVGRALVQFANACLENETICSALESRGLRLEVPDSLTLLKLIRAVSDR